MQSLRRRGPGQQCIPAPRASPLAARSPRHSPLVDRLRPIQSPRGGMDSPLADRGAGGARAPLYLSLCQTQTRWRGPVHFFARCVLMAFKKCPSEMHQSCPPAIFSSPYPVEPSPRHPDALPPARARPREATRRHCPCQCAFRRHHSSLKRPIKILKKNFKKKKIKKN